MSMTDPDRRYYRDSIAVMLPIEVLPHLQTDGGMAALANHLTELAHGALHSEYPHSQLLAVEWTFATTPEEVEAWPLPHDCEECRACKTMGVEQLRKHPTIICLGTLHCTEPKNLREVPRP